MKVNLKLVLIIFILLVYWSWLIPVLRVANDFPSVSESYLKSSVSIPSLWSENGAEGMGEYSAFLLWGWPLSFISGTLAYLGMNFEVIERLVFLVPFFLFGVVGIWKLSKEFELSDLACFISSIFYIGNTYIILLIDGGQLSIALAYAWFPISFLIFKKGLGNGVRKKIAAGIAVAVLGFFDFRFIYVLSILCLLLFFYQVLLSNEKNIHNILARWFSNVFLVGIIVLAIHFFWLYPLFKNPISSLQYQFFTQTSFLSNTNIGHYLLVLSPNWFDNVFGRITLLRFEFIFIPILVLLAPILKSNQYKVGFWLVVAVVGIFLASGTAWPFTNIYVFLFKYLPGFSLFRDSTKFFFLIIPAYSILIGVSVDGIHRKFRPYPLLENLIPFIFVLYILFLMKPVITGHMTGTFSDPYLSSEYHNLSNILRNDRSFGRVLWMPTFPPLGYADLNHSIEEASRIVQKRPFAVSVKGTYEIFNFLREAPYMGELFDVSGIEYIAYPFLNPQRDDMSRDNIRYYSLFTNQLSKNPWLSRVFNSPITLFKVNKHEDKLFIASNLWWVIGSDSLYNESTKSANLRLANNPMVFPEEYPGLGERLDEFPEAKIVLNNKTMLDLAMSFAQPQTFIALGNVLDYSPNQTGWWKRDGKDLIGWKNFLIEKYGIYNQDFDLGSGWSVSEGRLEISVNNSLIKKNNILLARVLESSQGGVINFYQNEELIGSINSKNPSDDVRWFVVGFLKNNSKNLKIQTEGKINVVNTISVMKPGEYNQIIGKANELNRKGRIIQFGQANYSRHVTSLSFNKKSATSYEVLIKNLSGPQYLVFSDTYDPAWKLNGQPAIPVYSLLNVYRIDRDGKYILEYEPQKYVFTGLLVSGFTILGLVSFFIFLKLRSKEQCDE